VHPRDRAEALTRLGLTPAEVELALPAAQGRCYGRRQVIFREGDPGDTVHVVVRGRVATTMSGPEGSSLTLAILGPGELFGELATLAPPRVQRVTARALVETETLALPRRSLATLRRAHPRVSEALLRLMARRAQRLGDRLYEAHFVPAETRVLRRLVELARTTPHGQPATLVLTQEELGGLAGAARATVNKVLREEEERGTVALGRGRISVIRSEQLARRAGLSEPGAA